MYKRILIPISIFLVPICSCQWAFAQQKLQDDGKRSRSFFIRSLTRIADPVLLALSDNTLKKKMPIEARSGVTDRQQYSHLEAFGRLTAGMAPWLELGAGDSEEGKIRAKYIRIVQRCIDHATDPDAPDFMNFNKGKQPLVDAAFLAQALLRAPGQLWAPLSATTKKNVLNALRSTKVIQPYNSNWLLFSAMVETALLKFEGVGDTAVITHAINMHFRWYKGDGAYGDGENFHWDYYNSFVIQPMLVEILNELVLMGYGNTRQYDTILKRAVRYAVIQERMISPEGTYPVIGRSLAYRFGAFQSLSQITLLKKLPASLPPAQVRAALTAVVKKQLDAPGIFDKNGFLQIGMVGHQPGLGETYISTGSLYLCAQVFLILGLPPDDECWTGADRDWTSKKVWKGEAAEIDHAIKD